MVNDKKLDLHKTCRADINREEQIPCSALPRGIELEDLRADRHQISLLVRSKPNGSVVFVQAVTPLTHAVEYILVRTFWKILKNYLSINHEEEFAVLLAKSRVSHVQNPGILLKAFHNVDVSLEEFATSWVGCVKATHFATF